MSQGKQKILEIERLRGLAVFMVMISHVYFFKPYVHPFLRQSWTGVDLFFVISGFIVSYTMFPYFPLLDSTTPLIERWKLHATALKTFFIKRVFRILPSSFFWMILPFSIALIFQQQAQYPGIDLFSAVREFISTVTFQYNYAYIYKAHNGYLGHYWSLSVEEQFYLLLPILFIFLPTLSQRFKFFAISAFFIAFIIRPLIPYQGEADHYWAYIRFASHNRFDSLFAGVCLGIYFYCKKDKTLNLSLFSRHFLVFSSILILWILPAALPAKELMKTNLLIHTFCAGILVYLSSHNQNYVLSIPYISKILEWMGARSYALYLIHIPSEKWIEAFLPQAGNLTKLSLWSLLTLLLADLSFRFLEKPFIRYGRNIVNQWKTA